MAIASPAAEGGGVATWQTMTGLSGLQGFTASMPFLILFLIMVLLINTFAGDDTTFWFLVLVFVSMVIVNADRIGSKLMQIQEVVK